MAQDRMIAAIGRIENALSRIEKAGDLARPSSVDDGIRQRHERLKTETGSILRDLDALLMGASR